MKVCAKCKIDKDSSHFYRNRGTADGLQVYCRPCKAESARSYYLANTQAFKSKNAKYYLENAEAAKARNAKYYSENAESVKAGQAKYRSENAEAITSDAAALRAAERCPAWADKAAIREVYAQAFALKCISGISYHVDHILPIKGKLVSGLHVASNLQILTPSENMSKNNKYTP